MTMILQQRGFVLLFLFVSLQLCRAARADSPHWGKFQNVSCETLNKKDLLRNLRSDFHEKKFHLPIKNYSFNFGFYTLANCWSLAHLQRLYFYLNDDLNPHSIPQRSEPTTESLADMIRGYSLTETQPNKWLQTQAPLQTLQKHGTRAWQELKQGFLQTGRLGSVIRRTLQSETEAYQISRFHNIKNFEYLTGEIPRTPRENRKTWSFIRQMIRENNLPMILLRPQYFSQHVVVAKRVLKDRIIVYDSNTPETESEIYFDERSGYFYAPQIIRGLPMVTNEFAPVGIFVVDSNELTRVRDFLFQDLKNHCESQN